MTDFFRQEVASYKQLPVNFYQVTTKFRDEIRPRFGVMRAREFIMKDAYSFHADDASLAAEYRNMYDTYAHLHPARVEVPRGGRRHRRDRRQRLARVPRAGGFRRGRAGVFETSDYAANVELAEAVRRAQRPAASEALRDVATPRRRPAGTSAALMGIRCSAPRSRWRSSGPMPKAATSSCWRWCAATTWSTKSNWRSCRGWPSTGWRPRPRSPPTWAASRVLGPLNAKTAIRVIADRSVAAMADFVVGANKPGSTSRA